MTNHSSTGANIVNKNTSIANMNNQELLAQLIELQSRHNSLGSYIVLLLRQVNQDEGGDQYCGTVQDNLEYLQVCLGNFEDDAKKIEKLGAEYCKQFWEKTKAK